MSQEQPNYMKSVYGLLSVQNHTSTNEESHQANSANLQVPHEIDAGRLDNSQASTTSSLSHAVSFSSLRKPPPPPATTNSPHTPATTNPPHPPPPLPPTNPPPPPATTIPPLPPPPTNPPPRTPRNQATTARNSKSKKGNKISKGVRVSTTRAQLFQILTSDAQRDALSPDFPNSALFYGTVVGGTSGQG